MVDLLKVANERSMPGILILDHRKKSIFFNSIALNIFAGSGHDGASLFKDSMAITLPDEISTVYETLKKDQNRLSCQTALISVHDMPYSCRGFFLQGPPGTMGRTFFIIFLIEKIMPRHKMDLEKFKKHFDLSDRQMEIVKHLLGGLTNKEIADVSCVSEDTIKGHLRQIMKRLEVRSRTGILSKVFQLFNEPHPPQINLKKRAPKKTFAA